MLIRLFLFSIVFVGCAVKSPTMNEQNIKVDNLEQMLQALGSNVNAYEASHLAINSVYYSQFLAKKYEVVMFPWVQNTLVNIGVKKRGLCYEWTEDLLNFLARQNYGTLQLHAIGANIGSLSEHNALAVSAVGEGVENSIVLDAWRDSGNLYFNQIYKDKKYEWKERSELYKILNK